MKKLLLPLLALATTAALSAAPAARLQAGAATSNITAPLGTLRVGSFAPMPTRHVHDEQRARCLVLHDGTTTLALVVCDLLGFHRSVSLEARRLIQEATGIPPENVLISATHTHSAGSAMGMTRYTNTQELDDYQRFVARRISDGVQRAKHLLRPAEIAFGKVAFEKGVINRRWHLKEGKERKDHFGRVNRVWKTGAPNDDFTKPAGPADPHVYFIAAREPDGTPISVYSAYSVHYTGGTGPGHISADYFGYYSEKLQRLLGSPEMDPPVVAMMANATSGDVGFNSRNYRDAGSEPYARPRALANDLAQVVSGAIRGLADMTWKDRAELAALYREPEIEWRKMEPELLVWAQDIEARAPRLPEGNIPLAARWATTRDFVSPLSYAGRVQMMAKLTEPAKVPLQVLRIGDICIGTSPCETYTEVGMAFRERSPFANSFMVQLSHGYIGYLPTPRHFELGGYSTWPGTNYLEPQASEKMVDYLVEMARELKPGTR